MLVIVLVLSGCSGGLEEKKKNRMLQVSRTMVSDLTNARTDNRTVDEVGEVFNKYMTRISSEVWKDWYDITEVNVRMGLSVAEMYGYYPLDSEVDMLYYGEESEGNYSYTVVSTMKVQEDFSGKQGKLRLYQYYEFNSEGILVNYHNSNRMLEGGL